MERTLGTILILVSAVGFGLLGIFARFAFDAGTSTETLLFLRERLTKIKIAALLIALVGTELTANPGAGGRIEGIALSLLAGVIYAVYIILSSRITRGVNPLMAAAVIIASAAVVYGVLVLLRGYQPPSEAGGWWAIVGLALLSTILPFVTFLAGLERVGASNAAVLSTLEPVAAVAAVAASVALFGMQLTPPHLVGGILVLAAVMVLTTQKRAST
jgi:drug/metabolite transporter (DMT)-like permease